MSFRIVPLAALVTLLCTSPAIAGSTLIITKKNPIWGADEGIMVVEANLATGQTQLGAPLLKSAGILDAYDSYGDIAFSPNGTLYALKSNPVSVGVFGAMVVQVNRATGDTQVGAPLLNSGGTFEDYGNFGDIAFSPDGTAYALQRNPISAGVFGAMVVKVNLATGERQLGAPLLNSGGLFDDYDSFGAIAFSPDGTLYALKRNPVSAGVFGAMVVKVNLATGQTQLGAPLLNSGGLFDDYDSFGDIAFDADGTLYALKRNPISAGVFGAMVVKVNLATGQTQVGAPLLNSWGLLDDYDSFGSIAFVPDQQQSGGAIPEPASWAMMISGLGAVGAGMRRRRALTVRFA